MQSDQFLFYEPGDLCLCFLHSQLVGTFDGQVDLALSFLGLLAGREVGAPDGDGGLRVLADPLQGFL